MLLNFSDRTRTGVFNMVWPYTFDDVKFLPLAIQISYFLVSTRNYKTDQLLTHFIFLQNSFIKTNSPTIVNKQPSPRQVPTQNMYYFMIYLLFSGLSLVLKKEGLWLTKMDTQPERTLRWATHRRQELIHTSCRSESSNISLVVLDKDPICGHCISIFHLHPTTQTKGSSDRSMAIAKSKFCLGLTLWKRLIQT